MPPAPKYQRLTRQQRKAQLTDCAVRAFAVRGIGRAVHADVAELAGVSVPTVFKYFPTREDLLEAVFGEVTRFFLDLARDAYSSQSDPLGAMVDHGRAFVDAVVHNSDHVKLWLEWSASIREGTWDRYLETRQPVLDMIASAVRSGYDKGTIPAVLDPDIVARGVFAVAYELVTLVHTPGKSVDDAYELIDKIADAMRGRGALA